MNTDSQFYNRSHSQPPQDLPEGTDQHTNDSTGRMDMVKRDCFELLSAYLDGEVTAAERRQVEEWLANDASVQCLYKRLLKLRQNFQTLPVPAAQQSPEATFQQVWARIRRRYQILWTVGGVAIAACAIGAVTSLLPGSESRTLQLAQQPQVEPQPATTKPVVQASPLMVALNNPVIEIPKTAVASPQKPVNRAQPQRQETKQDIN
jgi:anti-sigma factor RsiW